MRELRTGLMSPGCKSYLLVEVFACFIFGLLIILKLFRLYHGVRTGFRLWQNPAISKIWFTQLTDRLPRVWRKSTHHIPVTPCPKPPVSRPSGKFKYQIIVWQVTEQNIIALSTGVHLNAVRKKNTWLWSRLPSKMCFTSCNDVLFSVLGAEYFRQTYK